MIREVEDGWAVAIGVYVSDGDVSTTRLALIGTVSQLSGARGGQLRGTLRQAISLNGSGSRGSPSTRSPTMFR